MLKNKKERERRSCIQGLLENCLLKSFQRYQTTANEAPSFRYKDEGGGNFNVFSRRFHSHPIFHPFSPFSPFHHVVCFLHSASLFISLFFYFFLSVYLLYSIFCRSLFCFSVSFLFLSLIFSSSFFYLFVETKFSKIHLLRLIKIRSLQRQLYYFLCISICVNLFIYLFFLLERGKTFYNVI